MSKLFMNKKKKIAAHEAGALSESLAFIEESLGELGIKKKMTIQTVLLAEELIQQCIFTLSSSSAAMQFNIKTCTEKLGISPKLCNFSIPLGATVNMDGTSMIMVLFSLFLARAYGIVVPESAMLSLAVTIMLLSLGAPGVPGAGLVCLGVVLRCLGVPIEAMGLVLGIYPWWAKF